MTSIPVVASVPDLPEAVRYAETHPAARWYVARRAMALGRTDLVPYAWATESMSKTVLAAFKGEWGGQARDKAAAKGEAMSGEESEGATEGSFPIRDEEDLKRAIKAVGRAKDPAAARRHIVKRARALGKLDDIPNTWAEKRDGAKDEGGGEKGEKGLSAASEGRGGPRTPIRALRASTRPSRAGEGASVAPDPRPGDSGGLTAARKPRVPGGSGGFGGLSVSWDPDLHPRGKDGRFITKGGLIDVLGGRGIGLRAEAVGVRRNEMGQVVIQARARDPRAAEDAGFRPDADGVFEVPPNRVTQAAEAKGRLDTRGGENLGPGQREESDVARTVEALEDWKLSEIDLDEEVGPDDMGWQNAFVSDLQRKVGAREITPRQAREALKAEDLADDEDFEGTGIPGYDPDVPDGAGPTRPEPIAVDRGPRRLNLNDDRGRPLATGDVVYEKWPAREADPTPLTITNGDWRENQVTVEAPDGSLRVLQADFLTRDAPEGPTPSAPLAPSGDGDSDYMATYRRVGASEIRESIGIDEDPDYDARAADLADRVESGEVELEDAMAELDLGGDSDYSIPEIATYIASKEDMDRKPDLSADEILDSAIEDIYGDDLEGDWGIDTPTTLEEKRELLENLVNGDSDNPDEIGLARAALEVATDREAYGRGGPAPGLGTEDLDDPDWDPAEMLYAGAGRDPEGEILATADVLDDRIARAEAMPPGPERDEALNRIDQAIELHREAWDSFDWPDPDEAEGFMAEFERMVASRRQRVGALQAGDQRTARADADNDARLEFYNDPARDFTSPLSHGDLVDLADGRVGLVDRVDANGTVRLQDDPQAYSRDELSKSGGKGKRGGKAGGSPLAEAGPGAGAPVPIKASLAKTLEDAGFEVDFGLTQGSSKVYRSPSGGDVWLDGTSLSLWRPPGEVLPMVQPPPMYRNPSAGDPVGWGKDPEYKDAMSRWLGAVVAGDPEGASRIALEMREMLAEREGGRPWELESGQRDMAEREALRPMVDLGATRPQVRAVQDVRLGRDPVRGHLERVRRGEDLSARDRARLQQWADRVDAAEAGLPGSSQFADPDGFKDEIRSVLEGEAPSAGAGPSPAAPGAPGGSADAVRGMKASAVNKGILTAEEFDTRIGAVLDNPDTAAAHKDMAKLMTELKLGGKQRKRYRELLDAHHAERGDTVEADSQVIQAEEVSKGLKPDNPLKAKLDAKVESTKTGDTQTQPKPYKPDVAKRDRDLFAISKDLPPASAFSSDPVYFLDQNDLAKGYYEAVRTSGANSRSTEVRKRVEARAAQSAKRIQDAIDASGQDYRAVDLVAARVRTGEAKYEYTTDLDAIRSSPVLKVPGGSEVSVDPDDVEWVAAVLYGLQGDAIDADRLLGKAPAPTM